MKKLYIAPELEVVTLTLKDVILSSLEGNVPVEGNTDNWNPGEIPEIPELPDDL